MAIFGPSILSALFIGWVLYRTFIKKDLKKHKNEVFGGFFFMAVWALLYIVLTNISWSISSNYVLLSNNCNFKSIFYDYETFNFFWADTFRWYAVSIRKYCFKAADYYSRASLWFFYRPGYCYDNWLLYQRKKCKAIGQLI